MDPMDSSKGSSPKVPLLHADPRQEGIGQAGWGLSGGGQGRGEAVCISTGGETPETDRMARQHGNWKTA